MSKQSKEFILLVGRKPVRGYVTAVIVALKNGATSLVIKARGRSISRAVDITEILKRFTEPKLTMIGKIEIGTEEFTVEVMPDQPTPRSRRVSTIEIGMKVA